MRLLHLVPLALTSFFQQSIFADLTIGSVPADAPAGLSGVFSKHVDVLGLHVFAKSNVSNTKLLHCANVFAQWIDNNEDGVPDDLAVHQVLVDEYASMLMWYNENDAENDYDQIPDSTWDNYQFQELFAVETNLGYPENQEFDWTLEEVLHLVTHGGYAQAYPSVFGEFQGSQIANAMDKNISNGWYHYGDPTCDYSCKVTEYVYWSITSILGAQDYPWRAKEIADEWELYSSDLVQKHDPAIWAIMNNPMWNIATVLPDGSYEPSAPCPADLDGNGSVTVTDILILLGVWGETGHPADIDGSGTVDVGDVLAIVEAWGTCPE